MRKGYKPDDESNNELYQHWLNFRKQVLKTPHQYTRQRSTLENLCLFAVKKGLQNRDISEEDVKSLPPIVGNYLKIPKTPETPQQILKAFNDWAKENILELKQASSSSVLTMGSPIVNPLLFG